jgi:hypothetical protein
MDRDEVRAWLYGMDRKINRIDEPEEGDFFQAIECLESLLNEKTYDDGHNEGYDEGYSDGWQVGYDDGLIDGKLKSAKKEKCKPVSSGVDEIFCKFFDCSLLERGISKKISSFARIVMRRLTGVPSLAD